MTHTPDNGGQAFPGETVEKAGMHSTKRVVHGGMSLRDYFAGQVIACEVNSTDMEPLPVPPWQTYDEALADYWLGRAKFSYLVADAMLKARGVQS